MTITYQDLVNYADEAMPLLPEQWGTESQINAENEFFRLAKKFGVKTDARYKEWELKSTAIERIQATMKFAQDIERVRLTDEYHAWGKANGITDLQSADSQVLDEAMTDEQKDYLYDFCNRWEEMESRKWTPAMHQWQITMTCGSHMRKITVVAENAAAAMCKAEFAVKIAARN